MAKRLNMREEIFVLEYCIDWDHRRAALAAGYPNANWGVKALKKHAVLHAVEEERAARKDRLRVDGDRLTEEYAKIGYANARDYVPRKGDVLDIHRLNIDQTAAIERVHMKEVVDPITHEIRRELEVKLYDKVAALNSLAKSIGMLTERHVIEGTIEHVISTMTPEERLERVEQLRKKAEEVYLPKYDKMTGLGGQTIDAKPEAVTVESSESSEDLGGVPAESSESSEESRKTPESSEDFSEFPDAAEAA